MNKTKLVSVLYLVMFGHGDSGHLSTCSTQKVEYVVVTTGLITCGSLRRNADHEQVNEPQHAGQTHILTGLALPQTNWKDNIIELMKKAEDKYPLKLQDEMLNIPAVVCGGADFKYHMT